MKPCKSWDTVAWYRERFSFERILEILSESDDDNLFVQQKFGEGVP